MEAWQVITDDCPVGLRCIRRRVALMAAVVGSLLATQGAGMFMARGAMARTLRDSTLGQLAAARAVADWMQPSLPPPPPLRERCFVEAGKMMLPSRTPEPQPLQGGAPLPEIIGDMVEPPPRR